MKIIDLNKKFLVINIVLLIKNYMYFYSKKSIKIDTLFYIRGSSKTLE